MKLLKKIFLPIFMIGIFFVYSNKVNASSGSINVSSTKSTMVVGSSVTVTVTISSGTALGSWQFDVYYDSSKLQLTSSSFGGTHIVSYGNGTQKSASYTFNFIAKSNGVANVHVENSSAYAWDTSEMSLSNGSTNISIKTQAEIQASYSRNNNLASLSVDGYELSPSFDQNTLEYSLILDSTVEKININGSVADNTASVVGLGEREVSEGDNRIEINVTAQNGNVKTYVINATVTELNPIKVNINDEEYTVVKKKSLLEAPTTYEETIVKMGEEEIPAFKSSITDYTLIGLKDKDGNIGLYIYNDNENTYIKYIEYKFNQILIFVKEYDETLIPKGYKLYDMNIKGEDLKVYKTSKSSNYALLYGVNIETGNTNLYLYDSVEETIQRYNLDEFNKIYEENENLKKLLYLFAIGLIGLFIIIIIICFKKTQNREKKELKKLEKNEKKNLIKEQKRLEKLEKEEKKRIKEEEKANKKVSKKIKDNE